MATQIGLEATFDVKAFSAGLNIYLRGLQQATQATQAASRAISGFGSTLSSSLSGAGRTIGSIAPQIQQMTRGFNNVRNASQSLSGALSQNAQIFNAIRDELRDSQKDAQARAIIESRVTTEYEKQLAAVQRFAIAEQRLQRTAQLRQAGLSRSEIQRRLTPARNVTIDPTTDFDPNVLRQLNRGLDQGTGKVNKFRAAIQQLTGSSSKAEKAVSGLTTSSIALGTAIGVTAVAAARQLGRALAGIIREGFELVTFFERLQLSINFFAARSAQAENESLSFNQALRQTATEAQGLLLWVQELGVASPFTVKQVGTIFRVSQAYGLVGKQAQELLPLLIDLGSATGLDAQTLENAARALGQVAAIGRLTGEEVRQLGNAGIPIRDLLRKELSLTNEEFNKFLEAGRFTAGTVIPAITKSLRQFEGAAEKVAFDTLGGVVSSLQDISELGRARIFEGIFEPLQPILRDLLDTLNSNEFRASLTVIGEEIGTVLVNAINALRNVIGGAIEAWNNLDPAVKQAIITFGLAFVGITVVTGALGLLFVALNTLINPFTLVAAALAALVVAWTGVLDEVAEDTEGFAGVVLRSFLAVARGIRDFVEFFTNAFVGISDVLSDVGRSVSDWAESTGEVWATAFGSGAISGINRALSAIARAFGAQLAPGSPPAFLPDLVKWARDSGTEYAGGWADTNFDPAFGAMGESIRDRLRRIREEAADEAASEEIATSITSVVNAAMITAARQGGDAIRSERPIETAIVEASEAAVPVAEAAGYQVGDAYTRGFGLLFRRPTEGPVSDAISGLISQIGGGRELTRQGAEAFTEFLEGFVDADFGALDDAAGILEGFVTSLADIGDIQELDVPRLLFGAREEIAKAIQEFRKFGAISVQQFANVERAAGPIGDEVVRIIGLYQDLAIESQAVADAQDQLNAVTQRYDQLLDPLRAKLQGISDERQTAEEVRELAQLQRIVNSTIVTEERKRIAAAKIQEILVRRQVRDLERQQEIEEEAAKDTIEGAQAREEAAKSELDIFKQTLEARNEQLGLVADEAKLLERLTKELKSEREKSLSILERQLKFAALIKAEIADTITAAKAKRVLEDESSTALERQQAFLDLQTVALNRQNRELEARELGFNPEDLQQYRDVIVTLDDMGVKTKEVGAAMEEAFDPAIADLPNFEGLTKDLNDQLEKTRETFDGIKENIYAALRAANEALPTFLKIFPGEEGGVPPILTTLKNMAIGVAAVAALINTVKFIETLAKITRGITAIAGAIQTTGVIGLIKEIGIAAFNATPLILGLVAVLGVLEVAAAKNFLGFGDFVRAQRERIVEDILSIGSAIQGLINFFEQVFSNIRKLFTAEGRQEILAAFAEFRQQLSQDITTGELQAGIIEEARQLATNYKQAFTDTGNPIAALFLGTGRQVRDVLGVQGDEDAQAYSYAFETGLLTTEATPFESWVSQFADPENRTTLESVANELGASAALGIDEGFGSVSEERLGQSAIDFGANLVDKFTSVLGIKSPSTLTAEEIGVPIGEGIAEGLLSVDQSKAVRTVIDSIIDTFDDLRLKGKAKFEAFNKTLVESNQELQRNLLKTTDETNEGILESFTEFFDTLLENFEEIFELILEGWIQVGEQSIESVQGTSDAIVSEFQGLGPDIFTGERGLDALGEALVDFFNQLGGNLAIVSGNIRDSIVGVFVTDPNSIINVLYRELLGTGPGGGGQAGPNPNNPFYNLGLGIMQGIARGVISNWTILRDSLISAVNQANQAAQESFGIYSPSTFFAENLGLPVAQGITAGIVAGAPLVSDAVRGVLNNAFTSNISALTSPSVATATPTSVSNVSRTNNFNLNVSSSVPSQGVINDFGVMQVLAA